MKIQNLVIFLVGSVCCSIFGAHEERIIAYYQIQDYHAALNLIERQEEKEELFHLKMEILSKLGLTGQALRTLAVLPNPYDLKIRENFLNLESLAWSVLNHQKGADETAQIMAFTTAYQTRDAKAALLLKHNLESSNSKIRGTAVHFLPQFRDPFLKDALIQRFRVEKNREVKRAMVSAMGKMKMEEAAPFLDEILLSESESEAMKAEALLAYVDLYEKIELNQIQFFLHASRVHFKQLGLRLLLNYETFPEALIPDLKVLLLDESPEVKQEALAVIGLIRHPLFFDSGMKEQLVHLIDHDHPGVALFSAWAFSRLEEKAHPKLIELVHHPIQEIRLMAVVLIGRLGFSHEELVKCLRHDDLFVRLNAAYELIQSGKETQLAIEQIYAALDSKKELWMFDEQSNPYFPFFSETKVRHHPFIPAYPKVVDGMAKIQLLEAIAIHEKKGVKEKLIEILKEKEAVLTFYTIGLLLQENLESLDIVHELTLDPDTSVALAATLAYAFIAKEPDLAHRLVDLFETASFIEKIHILEALGALGNREIIPFLVDALKKPFSSLQILAASALIQSLYH